MEEQATAFFWGRQQMVEIEIRDRQNMYVYIQSWEGRRMLPFQSFFLVFVPSQDNQSSLTDIQGCNQSLVFLFPRRTWAVVCYMKPDEWNDNRKCHSTTSTGQFFVESSYSLSPSIEFRKRRSRKGDSRDGRSAWYWFGVMYVLSKKRDFVWTAWDARFPCCWVCSSL